MHFKIIALSQWKRHEETKDNLLANHWGESNGVWALKTYFGKKIDQQQRPWPCVSGESHGINDDNTCDDECVKQECSWCWQTSTEIKTLATSRGLLEYLFWKPSPHVVCTTRDEDNNVNICSRMLYNAVTYEHQGCRPFPVTSLREFWWTCEQLKPLQPAS